MNNNNDRQRELDEFWDISSLVVKPKKATPRPAQRADTSTAEIQLDAPIYSTQQAQTVADSALTLHRSEEHRSAPEKSAENTPEPQAITYTPAHPLIEQVTLHSWKNSFPYYERFCRMAQAYYSKSGTPTEHVPFFSYMPQYDQMNRSQTEWYLYLRDCIRRGEYPNTDYSYLFLLVFEIINLPDVIPPQNGLQMMFDLWRNYHHRHPVLNRYLCEWICDYCLIHQLQIPQNQPLEEIDFLVQEAQLREFYVNAGDAAVESDAAIYLRCCSNYDYKKSKVYRGDPAHAQVMDHHIPLALRAVLSTVTPENRLFERIQMQSSTATRDAFVGALCSYRIKKKIELRYRSFSRSHELRFFITDVVKYSENKLRAILGLKSRLSIYALPEIAKKALDAYFSEAFPKTHAKRAEESRPEYEKLYDSPAIAMSPEEAARIEESSWQTTRQLVEAFEEQDGTTPSPEVASIDETSLPTADAFSSEETKQSTVDNSNCWLQSKAYWKDFLQLALREDTAGQRRYCHEIGKMPESIADEINEAALDATGDIVLEQNDAGAFSVIEDYAQEIAQMLDTICVE